ncbi:MAG: DUF1998 domain-containing protein [Polyangiaceae bacterium]|nr:DUF1998 domain-containing protein [Polyangiaceae bacterium]
MQNQTEIPAAFQRHLPLRGRAAQTDAAAFTKECPGATKGFWRELRFGGERQTDVFELDLVDPDTGAAVGGDSAQTVARTLSIALREGLARSLGVDARELGCEIRSVQRPQRRFVISLFDQADGGAGYSIKAADDFEALFRSARAVLDCAAGCDRGCHACVLSYDSQRWEEEIDRKAALTALTPELIAGLAIAADYAAFGSETHFEPRGAEDALLREARRRPISKVRVHIGDDVAEWDWSSWSLSHALESLRREGCEVVLVTTEAALKALEADEARTLYGVLSARGFRLEAAATTEPLTALANHQPPEIEA